MDLGLADRVFILTGASRGLGFATAEALVADGARVVISSRSADKCAAAVDLLGGDAHAAGVDADLADPAAPGTLVETAMSRFGRLDGALISVGGPPGGTAASLTDEQWRQAFETVFLGSVRAARTFAAALPAGGAIGLVLSTSVRAPIAGLGLSNGLRPGLAMAAKDMADEFGPRGIRVVSLLPGRVMTDRNKELFAATGDAAAAEAAATKAIPLGRLGAPAEFGRVAAFVLSPRGELSDRRRDPGRRRRHARPVISRETLAEAAGRTIADLVGPDLRVLFSGINPSLYSAATGHHFARPGNRFWPALHRAGFTSRQLHPSEQSALPAAGLGITNVVARATARADELSPAELVEGGARLATLVDRWRPRYLAVLGVTAYRAAFGRPRARIGPQDETLAGVPVWVLPNPSGLNAHYTVDTLAAAYAELRARAAPPAP